MAQPTDDVTLVEHFHALRKIREQAQIEFEKSEQTIRKLLDVQDGESDTKAITALYATEAMRRQFLLAFGACTNEFRHAASLANRLQSLMQSKTSSSRQPRTASRVPPSRPYGTPVVRAPEDDVWTHKHIAPFEPGSQVAALIDEFSEPNLWILAQITSFDRQRCRYVVIDNEADLADGTIHPEAAKNYLVDCDRVLLLPSLSNIPVTSRHDFRKDECVLAIFPQTTVFYPATVVSGPKKGYYVLQFADDECNQRRISSAHVVPLPARYYNAVDKVPI